MKSNFAALAKTAKSYSSRIIKSGLSKYEVWIAYFACFVPAMTFTLAMCSFSLSELVKLQQSVLRSTLARLGINRNISRDPNFGGLGLRHLSVEQGIAQLELLLRHLRAKTTQGCSTPYWSVVVASIHRILHITFGRHQGQHFIRTALMVQQFERLLGLRQ
jgi:hypothetical protein